MEIITHEGITWEPKSLVKSAEKWLHPEFSLNSAGNSVEKSRLNIYLLWKMRSSALKHTEITQLGFHPCYNTAVGCHYINIMPLITWI